MSQVSITRDALSELRERIARCRSPSGICIIGPLEDRVWPSDSLEEAWLIEKLYGPRPRWVLHLMPLDVIGRTPHPSTPNVHFEEVCGMPMQVWTAEPIPRLSIELHGDAIRVCEVDA
jgi:hypothetical protein